VGGGKWQRLVLKVLAVQVDGQAFLLLEEHFPMLMDVCAYLRWKACQSPPIADPIGAVSVG
jgi:hypothetical protein